MEKTSADGYRRLFYTTFYATSDESVFSKHPNGRLFCQFFDAFVINFAHQTNPVERNVFVGLVNRGFFVFHFRTESAAAFQCAGIGSAADRNGFVVAPGMAVVNVHQGGNQFAFGVVVKRFLIMREFIFNARIFKRFAHFFRVVRSGKTDIRGDYKRAVLDFRNVGDIVKSPVSSRISRKPFSSRHKTS